MAEQKQDAVRIEWRQSVSWLSLFRGFRVALDVKKMFLGFVALVATYGVFLLLVGAWDLIKGKAPVPELTIMVVADRAVQAGQDIPGLITGTSNLNQVRDHFVAIYDAANKLRKDWPGFTLVFALLTLMIWSYFGGAISRLAAVQFGRDERISFNEALAFTGRKYLSLFFAPLIPLLAVAFVSLLTGVVGLLVGVKYFGEWFAAIFWILPLIVGFILALIIIGAIFGTPLMHPTIGVEGSDAFDAISRSFSYVYGRPWRAGFYAVLAIVYGILVFTFVSLFAELVLMASKFCVLFVADIFNWTAITKRFDRIWPDGMRLLDWNLWPSVTGQDPLPGSEKGAAFVMRLWVWLVYGLAWGFAVSYGYSALTIIYFLLRKNVDNTEFDEVYMEEEEEEAFEEPAEKPEAAAAGAKPETGEPPQMPADQKPTEGGAAPPADRDDAPRSQDTDAGA